MNGLKKSSTTHNESVISLLSHLQEGDSFGMLMFDDKVDEVVRLEMFTGVTESLKSKVLEIHSR